ncbi:MAG: helix-turn-helix transcriptional regulator [Dysgonomonas sp.]
MKDKTQDVYEKAVNIAIDYINNHLYDSLSVKVVSEAAGISGFHFHRIFKALIGENIGEYITRLRLEDIAQQLRMKRTSLSDIAFTTGYASKHTLSKAFKRHFGISPSVYRNQNINMSHFQQDNKDRNILDIKPEIKQIEQKRVVYIRIIDLYFYWR